jgi:hypothetical protein
MGVVRNIQGGQVKDLITKFFFRNNHLCFQILLHLEGNETIIYKEYNDYSEYKLAFNELQQIRSKNNSLIIPNKNIKLETTEIKVA